MAVDRFVRTRGWWPSSVELAESLRCVGERRVREVLAELRDDPIPLLAMRHGHGWSVTIEGYRQLGREPAVARYAFRPRRLPVSEKRRRTRARKIVEQRGAVVVFDSGHEDLPIEG